MLTPMLPGDIPKEVRGRKAALCTPHNTVEYVNGELARYNGKHVSSAKIASIPRSRTLLAVILSMQLLRPTGRSKTCSKLLNDAPLLSRSELLEEEDEEVPPLQEVPNIVSTNSTTECRISTSTALQILIR